MKSVEEIMARIARYRDTAKTGEKYGLEIATKVVEMLAEELEWVLEDSQPDKGKQEVVRLLRRTIANVAREKPGKEMEKRAMLAGLKHWADTVGAKWNADDPWNTLTPTQQSILIGVCADAVDNEANGIRLAMQGVLLNGIAKHE